MVGKTVELAVKHDIIQSKSIIVDATHTKARYNQLTPQEILRNRSKKVRKEIYSIDESMKEKFPKKPQSDTIEAEINYTQELIKVIDQEPTLKNYPKIKEPLNLLKETLEDDIEFLQESNDPDARVGHKSADSAFFGYKTHIAMSYYGCNSNNW
ncbi:hypothetical protein E3U55_17100 [Filobacillus milosensis]|uniref:Transposase IS4-like domain-containing protein n=1 Tax=Filobacillus milosensis TaxID=94137 RepID=A0A4Y8I9T7_9BACI|nr:hypothetical protein E3U55_17100 [Filobacillus milosensis]